MAVNNSNTDASNNPVPLYLIPWDPNSQDHVDRMKLQRIACGWKVDQVDSWRSPQREGKNGLHWVVSCIGFGLLHTARYISARESHNSK